MYNNESLKRFFLEVYNDEKLYQEYLNGNFFINRELYSKWFHDMEQRNELFSKSIKDFNRIPKGVTIVESQLSENLGVSSYFFNPKITTISNFEKFKIERNQLGSSNNHYICNGYFEDTLEQIYQVLDKGSFTVGICAEKKTDLFRDVVAHYNQLKDFLFKNGYQVGSIQTNVNPKNRVYLLMYDHIKIRR